MKLRLLRWILGLAKIIDGIIIFVTLGLVDPDLTSEVNAKILFEAINLKNGLGGSLKKSQAPWS